MQHLQEIGTQHSYALPVPPVSNQQTFPKPPIAAQQNMSGPQMQSHLLPAQSINRSQITNPQITGAPGSQSSPRSLAGSHGYEQSSTNYQTRMTNSQNTSLPQLGVGPYISAPPPVLPPKAVSNPTASSQFESRQYAPLQSTTGQHVPPHSTMGQHVPPPHPMTGPPPMTNLPGPGFPQIRQKQYLQTVPPPMPGQTIASAAGPALPPSGQRQYGCAPPLPGQALSSPLAANRTLSGTNAGDYQQPTYQQQPGYHNQMVQLDVTKVFVLLD